MRALYPLILITVAALCGCASTHRKEAFVDSLPTGAEVWVQGEPVGRTPLWVTLDFGVDPSPWDTIAIQVAAAGYRPQTRHVTHGGPEAILFNRMRSTGKEEDE